ncbi:unnamed protein product [Allacma fusca]|uniref:Reelin domain-containing protein n=1 Tax=Allacma fusca TaxID=39272 RepID=A0A8J2LW21_9HEXA|nr:unnamed protein product [Allacma fusca]
MIKVLVVLLLGITAMVTAFSDNVPETTSTCVEMTPGHGDGPQNSASPYQVVTSVTRLKSGEHLEVFINGTAFRGFYVQARDSEGNPVGSFLPNNLTETHSCFGKKSNAAHHNSPTSKTSLRIFWNSPSNFTGKVAFTGTVVKDFATYWTFIKSKPIEIQA